jgi:hypothetical protein
MLTEEQTQVQIALCQEELNGCANRSTNLFADLQLEARAGEKSQIGMQLAELKVRTAMLRGIIIGMRAVLYGTIADEEQEAAVSEE